MLDLEELKQLAVYAECGTLSKAAERLNMSQPTVTRTMYRIEEEFGVKLFEREKNRIRLNQTGEKAVQCSLRLLEEAENALKTVRDFDISLHTVSILSCAPVPLWTLVPRLSAAYPSNTVSGRLEEIDEIINAVAEGSCDIGILPCGLHAVTGIAAASLSGLADIEYLRERLSICVPHGHPLADRETLCAEDINGYNCLLRDQIGFWTDYCYNKMPASKFLVQTDEAEMEVLVRSSTLLCFVSNLAEYDEEDILKNRRIIPLTDPEADVTFHMICRSDNAELCEILRNAAR